MVLKKYSDPKFNLSKEAKYIGAAELAAKNGTVYIPSSLRSYTDRIACQPLSVRNLCNSDCRGTHQRQEKRTRGFGNEVQPLPLEEIETRAASLIEPSMLSLSPNRLAKWEHLDDHGIKLVCAQAAIVRYGCFRSFTLHFSEQMSKAALEWEKGPVDFIRRRFRDKFRDRVALKSFDFQKFFVIEYSAKRSRERSKTIIHIHGSLSMPDLSEETCSQVIAALKAVGGAKDYDFGSGGRSDQVRLSKATDFLPGHKSEHFGQVGWGGYCAKDMNRYRKQIGDKRVFISNKLKAASRALYDVYQRASADLCPANDVGEALPALFEFAIENIRCRIESSPLGYYRKRGVGPHFSPISDGGMRFISWHIPDDETAFREVVEILKLPGLEQAREAFRNETAFLKVAGLEYLDGKRFRKGRTIEMKRVRDGLAA